MHIVPGTTAVRAPTATAAPATTIQEPEEHVRKVPAHLVPRAQAHPVRRVHKAHARVDSQAPVPEASAVPVRKVPVPEDSAHAPLRVPECPARKNPTP